MKMPKMKWVWGSLALLLLLLWFVTRLVAWGSCSWYGNQTNREVRYVAFIGCTVKVNDQWIPRNELRVIQ
jgi:hypothetical protein